MNYSLGLDIGIASVGWAVLENDLNGEPIKIVRLGSRVFTRAEEPKTGASLAAPRREARSARRRTRRRRHRKERIRNLIAGSGLMGREEMDSLFLSGNFERDVYDLRVDVLDRLLTDQEAVRLLIHYAQRRGYRSNSKAEEAKNEKETGLVKAALSENREKMAEHGYRTVGEMLALDEKFFRVEADGTRIRTPHNEPGEYRATVERSLVQEEIELAFSTQRALGASWATEDFCRTYLDIWSGQRSFDEGPGGNSPYGGAQIEKMLGECTFEPGEKRAPKDAYSAERFRLLQDIAHMRTVREGGEPEPLTPEQRAAAEALAMRSPNITYARLRKELKLPPEMFFNGLYYGDKGQEEAEKRKLNWMVFYHRLRTALNKVEKGAVAMLTPEMMDEIARILFLYKSDDKRTDGLRAAGVPEHLIPPMLELSTSKAGSLSGKAIRRLLPYLEQGQRYSDACMAVYGRIDGRRGGTERKKRLSVTMTDEIRNPVVLRAVSQTIKVINAIVRAYGPPECVRIELARELGKPLEERNRLEKRINENASRNERIREQVREIKEDTPTGLDIVKFKLFEEQQGICLYSGKNLDPSRLYEAGYADVDHILPYSRSFDDSYNNKVLVLASENRQKGNRTPFEYFGRDAARWDRFTTLAERYIRSYKKRRNLLGRSFAGGHDGDFIRRNLTDTQYLSRVLYRLIGENLLFAETGNYKKQRVFAVSGAVTAMLRGRWGLEKVRAEGDLHHAQDAAVIACVSPGLVQKVTRYSRIRENGWRQDGFVDYATGEVITREQYEANRFPPPWPRFRDELLARLGGDPRREIDLLHLPTYEGDEDIPPVFVSRMPVHKATGAGHQETVRSGRVKGSTVTKTALTKLKVGKNGEITGYYRPEDDPLLYNALLARLREFDNNADKAFAPPFVMRKPMHNGQPGPVVKKVKIEEKASLTVPVNRGLAANGSMVRLDVFHVEGDGWYFVPIYTADTVKPELPDRAAVAHKPYEQWKAMREEDFRFSLCAGDLIRIRNRKPIKLNKYDKTAVLETMDSLFYYEGFNISTAALALTTHDRRFRQDGLGGKTLMSIEKYEVDALGDYRPAAPQRGRERFR